MRQLLFLSNFVYRQHIFLSFTTGVEGVIVATSFADVLPLFRELFAIEWEAEG